MFTIRRLHCRAAGWFFPVNTHLIGKFYGSSNRKVGFNLYRKRELIYKSITQKVQILRSISLTEENQKIKIKFIAEQTHKNKEGIKGSILFSLRFLPCAYLDLRFGGLFLGLFFFPGGFFPNAEQHPHVEILGDGGSTAGDTLPVVR